MPAPYFVPNFLIKETHTVFAGAFYDRFFFLILSLAMLPVAHRPLKPPQSNAHRRGKILRGHFEEEHMMAGATTLHLFGPFYRRPNSSMIWELKNLPDLDIITPSSGTGYRWHGVNYQPRICAIYTTWSAVRWRAIGRSLKTLYDHTPAVMALADAVNTRHDGGKAPYPIRQSQSARRFVEHIVMAKNDGSYDAFHSAMLLYRHRITAHESAYFRK